MNSSTKSDKIETPSPSTRKGGLLKKNTLDNNILLKSKNNILFFLI